MEYTFTNENFQAEVLDSEQPVLVDMFATWCGPCRMMGPVVEELAKEYEGSVKVGNLTPTPTSSTRWKRKAVRRDVGTYVPGL